MTLLFEVAVFFQENADTIRPIMICIIAFIVFLIILNLINRKPLEKIETIERNTEYMKNDFRIIKKELDELKEKYKDKNKIDISDIVYKMLYETPNLIKNEFIIIKRKTLQLSSLGIIVNLELNLNLIVTNNWNKIYPYLKESNDNFSNHPYDINLYCLYLGSCLEQFFSQEEISVIKHYAYEEGHNISSYFAIIGILIRDIFFENEQISITKLIRNKIE